MCVTFITRCIHECSHCAFLDVFCPQTPPARTEQEIAEEEELQLAIALSRSEAESKDKEVGIACFV